MALRFEIGTILLLAAFACARAASAQPVPPNGPPIPADQVFRSQPTMVTPAPRSLPGPPPITSDSIAPNQPLPPSTPDVDLSRDRVARCQHEAVERGIRRSRRGAYVHTCAYGG